MPGRPRILILGGGFAGIGAAKKLKDAEADVVLVDKHNYHTFSPMLYQVATDLVAPATVGHPLRDLFHEQPNVEVHEASVSKIDLAAKRVSFAEMDPITYDYLVLALGAVANFFGVEGADKHSFPLYSLPDAVRLKDQLLERWEAADRDPSLRDDGALNVVVVGGGPTGIESAGAIIELYRSNFSEDYPKVPDEDARVFLVEAGDALVTMFRKKLQTYTTKALEKRGVNILMGEAVEKIESKRVTLQSGKVLKAHTLVWGAGLQAHPSTIDLGVALERGNRVPVRHDLSMAEHTEVFAVGDVAWITDSKTNKVLPQLGSVALQAGERAGGNLHRELEGKKRKPFEYHDKGMMATIGRRAAVVQLPGGKTLTGTTASLAWGAVHLALLSTGEDRGKAVVDWAWAGFTHERAQRITVRTDRD